MFNSFILVEARRRAPNLSVSVPMSLFRFAALPLLALTSAGACAGCGVPEHAISALRQILATDPASSAQSAIANGDTTFLGVAGIAIIVPAVETPSCHIDRSRVRILPGTTDVVCGEAHQHLIGGAFDFAGKYNLVIKQFLVDKGDFRCGRQTAP